MSTGYPYGAYSSGASSQDNGMGTAAMVLGLLGLVCVLPLVGSILGIVFGIIGLRRVDQGLANNRGMAQAGLVMGWIGVALFLLAFVVFLIAIAASA